MKYIQLNSDWLSVVLLLSEISRPIPSFSVDCIQNARASVTKRQNECLFTVIMSTKRKRSVISLKDKRSINLFKVFFRHLVVGTKTLGRERNLVMAAVVFPINLSEHSFDIIGSTFIWTLRPVKFGVK